MNALHSFAVRSWRTWAYATGLLLLPAQSALACAACYGQSDSPLAEGMNWGILSLLGVIGLVLAGVAGFFVYLARRAARVQEAPATAQLAESAGRI